MRKLFSECWSQKVEERRSFDDIFELLSSDFSHFDEEIDEEEVYEYLAKLSEFEDEQDKNNIQTRLKEVETENDNLKKKLNQMKNQCNKYQNELKTLLSTNDDYFLGLYAIIGDKRYRSIHSALNHLNRSSEKGNRYASYLLGILYSGGELVDKNIEKAIEYYRLSFVQGNPKGYTTLGTYPIIL